MSDAAAPQPTPEDADKVLEQILTKLRADPVLAHAVIFKHRHPQASPDFHREIILDIWSAEEYVANMAFRGGAKSTLTEEAAALMALFGIEKYILIVGSGYDRACERLAAIKHELDTNDMIQQIFGDPRGPKWGEDEIILKNGCKIQALGQGQDFRGTKHWDSRPTLLLIDDLEKQETVETEIQRAKLANFVSREVIPACEPTARKRVVGTPLHPKAWLERMRQLAASGQSKWKFNVYPIVIPAVSDPDQWEYSQWPERFPLDRIKEMRAEYERNGDLQGFVQEYLCQSEEAALKPFQQRHIIQAPHIPEWAPTILIADPARTVTPGKSARTGYVVISPVGAKCYVRYASASYHLPSETINELFRLDDIFRPIHIAVEKDGLEQYLMEPLRAAQRDRGVLPIIPIMAPRDKTKDNFIRGLQPFAEAGDILMCGEFPELVKELLGFPTGLKDIVNALAYWVRLRGGKPVYEDFGFAHVAPELQPNRHSPLWLVVNCDPKGGSHTTAVLVQHVNGAMRVFADFVREGTPDDTLPNIIPDAVQVAGGVKFKLAAPADQFDQYNNFGMGRAIRRLNIRETMQTPHPDKCLAALKPLLRSQSLAQAAFLVSRQARWTINALAMGYAFGLDKSAVLNPHPNPGYYATLMRGLESFARSVSVGVPEGQQGAINWQETPDGRRYMSSRATGAHGGTGQQPLKIG